jgi:hypothetical protein
VGSHDLCAILFAGKQTPKSIASRANQRARDKYKRNYNRNKIKVELVGIKEEKQKGRERSYRTA